MQTTISELVDALLEITGSDLEPEYRPQEQMFVTHRVGSTEKAERLLGFRAAVPLEEGLRSVVEWRRAGSARRCRQVSSDTDCVLSLDLDWAPDAAIDAVAQILVESGVPATWLVTHASPAVDRLRDHGDLFELGIHPNFLPGSTHGSTTAEVLDHCMALVPDAVTMRTHALVQSTPILSEVLERTPIRVDLSLFLPRASGIEPVEYRWRERSLVRLPYVWEDDVELENGTLDAGFASILRGIRVEGVRLPSGARVSQQHVDGCLPSRLRDAARRRPHAPRRGGPRRRRRLPRARRRARRACALRARLRMKIAVLGRTHWLSDAAARLLDAGHELTLVATAPAAPEYRAVEEDFRALAARAGASFALDEIPETDAELAVSVNWPQVLGRDVIDRFPRGIVNAHAGDLPRYRGNAAPNWAIINGEQEVVLTLHLMDEGLDSGPVLAKWRFPLGARTTIGDVYAWLDATIPAAFLEVVDGLAAGTIEPRPQPQDPALALRVPRRRPEDSELRWGSRATELDRVVRASSEPFAGAFSDLDGERVTVWRAKPEGAGAGEAFGTLLEPRLDGVPVSTADGLLVLEEVELGGRRGPASEILRDARGRLGRA